jgi:hypothetical protein
MPSINGVDFNNISSIKGVLWSSVSNVAGVTVSHGPSCTSQNFGYSDGRRNPPSDSCFAPSQPYDFDSTNGLLYIYGGCGNTLAAPGYYSDGRQIFFWDGSSSFSFYSACGR